MIVREMIAGNGVRVRISDDAYRALPDDERTRRKAAADDQIINALAGGAEIREEMTI